MPEDRKSPPKVRARSAGRVTQTMETLADLYRSNNPDREVRYVYDPEHKPELSNMLSRKAQGYRPVMAEELGEEVPGFEKGKPVRLADVVLMSIERSAREEMEADLAERGEELRRSVDRKFYEEMENLQVEGPSGVHKGKPIGRSIIEERDFEHDIEQRQGD